MQNRPNVLTIAGFDPSSGAGLTADIKTFEALKCYGIAVCTANTIQNDKDFEICHWIEEQIIKDQIEVLLKRFKIDYVKIGIIQNWKVLLDIIDFLLEKNSNMKIVLDPVLKSSSAYDFHELSIVAREFEEILDKIYLLTPNYSEIKAFYPDKTIKETIQHISNKTNVLLKGGHREEMLGKDELFTKQGTYFVLNPKNKNMTEKHGSGCVLSSAITAYLSQGFPLLKSCYRGKRYIEKVLSSNTSLLGYHKF